MARFLVHSAPSLTRASKPLQIPPQMLAHSLKFPCCYQEDHDHKDDDVGSVQEIYNASVVFHPSQNPVLCATSTSIGRPAGIFARSMF